MRRGPEVSGWAGSLFPEPIEQVAAPWASKPVDTFAGAAFRQPALKIESNQNEGLDFSKEWYYCASGNAIRNHLPCDECIRSEPREEIHCIRFFKLHPCAYFNSAQCNGSTCEYWSPYGDNPHCTYGPYLAWLAVPPAPAIEPAKKPVKAKKQPIVPKRGDNYCVLRGGDCAVHNGCQNGDVPCTLKDVPHLEEIHLPCEIHALLDLAVEPMKPTIDVVFHLGDRVRVSGQLLGYVHRIWDDMIEVALGDDPKLAKAKSYVDGVTYTAARLDEVEKVADAKPSRVKKPKSEAAPVLQDCSDCLCPSCANNGASCTDCKGPEKCAKHNTKMGLCPDFRWKDGKEQDCMHGCLCIGCALVGQECKECVGPLRCTKPTMKCKKYVGGDMEDIGEDTEDPYTPEHPYPGDGKVPDLIDVLEGKVT